MGRCLSHPKYVEFKEKCNLSKRINAKLEGKLGCCAPFTRMVEGLNRWAENNRLVRSRYLAIVDPREQRID